MAFKGRAVLDGSLVEIFGASCQWLATHGGRYEKKHAGGDGGDSNTPLLLGFFELSRCLPTSLPTIRYSIRYAAVRVGYHQEADGFTRI
jgi:hypothetical protein